MVHGKLLLYMAKSINSKLYDKVLCWTFLHEGLQTVDTLLGAMATDPLEIYVTTYMHIASLEMHSPMCSPLKKMMHFLMLISQTTLGN